MDAPGSIAAVDCEIRGVWPRESGNLAWSAVDQEIGKSSVCPDGVFVTCGMFHCGHSLCRYVSMQLIFETVRSVVAFDFCNPENPFSGNVPLPFSQSLINIDSESVCSF